jgi:hypothetical protein
VAPNNPVGPSDIVCSRRWLRKAKEKTKGSRRHTAEYLIAENPKHPKAIVMAFLT